MIEKRKKGAKLDDGTKRLVAELYEYGKEPSEISKIFGISPRTVGKIVRDFGIPCHRPSSRENIKKMHEIVKQRKNEQFSQVELFDDDDEIEVVQVHPKKLVHIGEDGFNIVLDFDDFNVNSGIHAIEMILNQINKEFIYLKGENDEQ